MSEAAAETDTDLAEAKRRLIEKMLSGGASRPQERDRIAKRPHGATASMSLEQRNVWLHASMAPDQPLYNEPVTIHRRGSFDLGTMEKAFNAVLRRHEAWRTSFQPIDGEVVPVASDNLHVTLPLVDLTGFPPQDREAEAIRLATEDARRPFDLTAAPLLRVVAIRLAPDDHRLYLTLHHTIFDGVSLYSTIVPELAAIYEAFAADREPALPEPELQYGDYAAWREKAASGDTVAKQMKHWRQSLAGELPTLQLPADRPRPARLSYRGSMERFALSAELTEAIKDFSRSEGLTVYMTLLAAFKALLHRYSGQDDIIIGGVTDTRTRPELQGVVGYFLNSLALRTQPQGAKPFREYLAEVRNTVAGALSASEVPFDRIVREIQPRRDPGAHPLFQVLFSVQPPAPKFADGWDLTQMDVTVGTSKFDLYLELEERPEGVIGRFLYSTELFDAATIRRMIEHWRTMLQGIVAAPDCCIGELPLLTAAESRLLLETWNDNAADIPATTLHGLFECQARVSPDAIAIERDGARWTYSELDRRASGLSGRLTAQGVGPGMLVAICVDRSLDMMAGILAILKTGAAYLPLDPAFPAARLALILDDAKPALLLTQTSLVPSLPEHATAVVLLEDMDRGIEANASAGVNVASENLAYVIYTSGSTGKPKGVEIPHRAVVNLLSSMAVRPGFTKQDSILAVTTLSFDISVLELFLPLVTGGRVILARHDEVVDPARLAQRIAESSATCMQATPATWRALIESGWSGNKGLKILCGGEALPRDLADKLLTRADEVWNMYGPTETTIWSTVHRVTRGDRTVPIGRPIANTRTYILDANRSLVPVGVTGELCIGGAGVARGYRNKPELTREKFIESPARRGEQIYRTGDLARYRADGTIECLGRTDQQVKIRGFRIELEDIESALNAHPGVAAAAVRAWPGPSGELDLCAYVVRGAAASLDVAEIREFLKQRLPDYMVPSRYVWPHALPMTPNAKVDRKALPEPKGAILPAFVSPRNAEETRLAAIWKDVLRVDAVGANDDFFNLGGHSLLLARLLRRIETEFGCRLSMASAFHASTLGAMAALLTNDASAAGSVRAVGLQPKGSKAPLFWLNDLPTVRPLAAAMGTDRPFFSISLDALQEDELGNVPSLPEIARCYIRNIQAVRPHGPYRIGGWCTSGILAFEVATQLAASGAQVDRVILLHSANPVHFGRRQKVALEYGRLRYGLEKSLAVSGRSKWSFAIERILANAGRIFREFRRPLAASVRPAFSEILDRAAVAYEPSLYTGDVVLLQPQIRPEALDYRIAWVGAVVAGKLKAIDCPGTHYTMLEPPFVSYLGATVDACLQDAERGEAEPRAMAG